MSKVWNLSLIRSQNCEILILFYFLRESQVKEPVSVRSREVHLPRSLKWQSWDLLLDQSFFSLHCLSDEALVVKLDKNKKQATSQFCRKYLWAPALCSQIA